MKILKLIILIAIILFILVWTFLEMILPMAQEITKAVHISIWIIAPLTFIAFWSIFSCLMIFMNWVCEPLK